MRIMLQQLQYWTKELKDIPSVSDLQEQYNVNDNPGGDAQHAAFILNEGETLAIRNLVNNAGMGVYVYCLAALQLTLRLYLKADTVTVFTGAFSADKQSLYALRKLCLIAQPDMQQDVRSFLNEVREKVLNACQYQYYDDQRLFDRLPEVTVKALKSEGIWFSYDAVQQHTTPVDKQPPLSVEVRDAGKELAFNLQFTDKFLPGFSSAFSDILQYLLVHLKNAMDKSLAEIVSELNSACGKLVSPVHTPIPVDDLVTLFRQQATSHPDTPAAYWNNRSNSLTYQQLDGSSDSIAASLLQEHRLHAGEVVAVYAAAGIQFLVASLGILKAGGVVLAIEEVLPPERISYMITNSECRIVLTDKQLPVEGPCVLDIEEMQKKMLPLSVVHTSSAAGGPDRPAFIIYTSGSTGQPKGVVLSHCNLVNQFVWFKDYFNFQTTDVLPQKSALSFVDYLTEMYLPVTVCPGAVYLRPYDGVNKDTAALVDWFRNINVTVVLYTPSLFEYVATAEDITQLTTLRHLVLGGEEVKRRYKYHFNTYNLYGNSECSSITSVFLMEDGVAYNKIPIGKPIFNSAIYVLDEHMNPLPYYMQGELYIGGAGVGLGYLHDPVKTAERFSKSPFHEGEILYRTGDFGRLLPDGNIEYAGRRDKQVKIHGIRMNLDEIENKIREICGPDEIAVLLVEKNNEKHLAAICVCKNNRLLLQEERAREVMLQHLPVHMVPVEWVFVDEMPYTPSGKIDRSRLQELLLRHVEQHVAPEGEAELLIHRIWCNVLKLENIHVLANFFVAGGHSLNMVQVLHQLNKQLQVNLSLHDFITHPTIRALSILANKRRQLPATSRSPVVALNEHRPALPALVVLHPFNGFAMYAALGKQLEGQLNVYGMHLPGVMGSEYRKTDDLGELADYYYQLLQDAHIQGQLTLCGYSASVPMVFELGKRMQGSGRLQGLILVDDYFKGGTRLLTDEEATLLLNSEISYALAGLLGMERQVILALMPDLTAIWQQYMQTAVNGTIDSIEALASYVSYVTDYFRLQLRYQPSGSVQVDTLYAYSEKYGRDEVWKQFISGDFRQCLFSGVHADLFQPGHVEINAVHILRNITAVPSA